MKKRMSDKIEELETELALVKKGHAEALEKWAEWEGKAKELSKQHSVPRSGLQALPPAILKGNQHNPKRKAEKEIVVWANVYRGKRNIYAVYDFAIYESEEHAISKREKDSFGTVKLTGMLMIEE